MLQSIVHKPSTAVIISQHADFTKMRN